MAADDGNPRASVKAQTSLGMFYSSPETQDLKKVLSSTTAQREKANRHLMQSQHLVRCNCIQG